eukprot:GHVN01103606.1.p1 GENE.GHVN01103606.1~~GHVN01103606.1.p1  ORF type:complete len:727 (+),score=74.30 GHVN01103606.1:2-2182(+)
MNTTQFGLSSFQRSDALERILDDDSFESIERGLSIMEETKKGVGSEVSTTIYNKSDEYCFLCEEMTALDTELKLMEGLEAELLPLKESIIESYELLLGCKAEKELPLPQQLKREKISCLIKNTTKYISLFIGEIERKRTGVFYILSDKVIVVEQATNELLFWSPIADVVAEEYNDRLLMKFDSRPYRIKILEGITRSGLIRLLLQTTKMFLEEKRNEKKALKLVYEKDVLEKRTELVQSINICEYNTALEKYTELKAIVSAFETVQKDTVAFHDILIEARRELCSVLLFEITKEYSSLKNARQCAVLLSKISKEGLAIYLNKREQNNWEKTLVACQTKEDFLHTTVSLLVSLLVATVEDAKSIFEQKELDVFLNAWLEKELEKNSLLIKEMFETHSLSLERRCALYSMFQEQTKELKEKFLVKSPTAIVSSIQQEAKKRCEPFYSEIKKMNPAEDGLDILEVKITKILEVLECLSSCGLGDLTSRKIVVGISFYLDILRNALKNNENPTLVFKQSFELAKTFISRIEDLFLQKHFARFRVFRSIQKKAKEFFKLTAGSIANAFVAGKTPKVFLYNTEFVFVEEQGISMWMGFFVKEMAVLIEGLSVEKSKLIEEILYGALECIERTVCAEDYVMTKNGLSQLILDIHFLLLLCDFAVTDKCSEKIGEILSKTIRDFFLKQETSKTDFKTPEWFDERARILAKETGICFFKEFPEEKPISQEETQPS